MNESTTKTEQSVHLQKQCSELVDVDTVERLFCSSQDTTADNSKLTDTSHFNIFNHARDNHACICYSVMKKKKKIDAN